MIRIKVPCAMTIAGSDSCGGAGIAADLKTFAALNVYGALAITAITVQDTTGVYEVMPLPKELVKNQIEVVLKDIDVGAVKTGMLYSEDIIETVAEIVEERKIKLVVDPVLRAGSGDPLSRNEAKEAYVKSLLPVALAVTPNIPEAEVLTGMSIKSVKEMKEAAEQLLGVGPKVVVIKGGHLEGTDVTDVAFIQGELKVFQKKRYHVNIHGGGCTYSAALTAYLAQGRGLAEAVQGAESFIDFAIKYSFRVGKGRKPVNPMAELYVDAEKYRVLEDVSEAVRMIESHPEFKVLVPEVGMQVAMATPLASDSKNIAAIDGRIFRHSKGPKAAGPVIFGASSHVARIVLAAMQIDPSKRAAINLRYSPELVEAFKKTGLNVASFDRAQEPKEIKDVEAGTLGWGVAETAKETGVVPDVIYDLGEVGKEPMIRLIGTSATELVDKIMKASGSVGSRD